MGERGFADVENSAIIEQLLETLADREREIVRLRFYGEMSQVDIAAEVGVSQMHISRLLKKAFGQLRDAYGDVPPSGSQADSVVGTDDVAGSSEIGTA